MSFIHGFPPLGTPESSVLVLGTMPGKVSLLERQYYAHPRNLFWRITGGIFGFDPALPYPLRVASLTAAGVAVWDVLQSCTRGSSLDSDIDDSTVVPNDFAAFFADYPHVRRVFFNGAKAAQLFLKHVQPDLAPGRDIRYVRLPSTSPANAAIPFADRARSWSVLASHGFPPPA